MKITISNASNAIKDINDFVILVQIFINDLKKFQFPKDLFNLGKYTQSASNVVIKWAEIQEKYK